MIPVFCGFRYYPEIQKCYPTGSTYALLCYPYEHIQLEKDGHLAWLRFNRVTKANAMNYAHLWEVEHAALSLRDEADIRVVIITGNGLHLLRRRFIRPWRARRYTARTAAAPRTNG